MIEKLPVAFLAGLLSVVTPCVLPLVPGYICMVSGLSAAELTATRGTSTATTPAPASAGAVAVGVVVPRVAVSSAAESPETMQM